MDFIDSQWWRRRQRVVQTNLRIKDTDSIDPERLAAQVKELYGSALVFNVGGIYAWYPTDVPYHHRNEYLPAGRDLLAEVIAACHARGIKFIGRFDFSKAEDRAYQSHPEWFAYTASSRPMPVGAERPGEWSILYSTCINSGYWNEEMAFPALKEALSRYDIDAVFLNAPFPTNCHCEICADKYLKAYGNPLPQDDSQFEPSWRSLRMEWNISAMKAAINEAKPDTP
ncbi:MAG: family 10 glycosylhydrolase, partial [Clostridiales bacterium]|nr:family 10 glycosylhydrolase [Clostridiales bacterium]